MNETQNYVTHRRQKIRRSSSLVNLSKDDSSLFETTMRSLPNSSLDESQTIIDLNDKIRALREDLTTAHTEIENLNSENNQLKTDLEKYLHTIKTLKQVTESPLTGRKKRQKSRSSTPKATTPVKTNSPEKSVVPEPSSSAITQSSLLPTSTDNDSRSHKTDLSETSYSVDLEAGIIEVEVTTDSNIKQLQRLNLETSLPVASVNDGQTSDSNIEQPQSTNFTRSPRNKIIVIGDDQGRNMQRTLQRLVGERYLVSCFWKAGATLQEVLSAEKTEIEKLKHNDYLIVLAGCNDKSPFCFQSCLVNWLMIVEHTNVLISEIPSNNYLSEKKLNYELKFNCLKFQNVRFVDMKYSIERPSRRFFTLHACQNLLREILNLSNKIKYNEYLTALQVEKGVTMSYLDKGTQTDEMQLGPEKGPNSELTSSTIKNSTFFRS